MNLEQLNVVALSSEELVETTGGHVKPASLSQVWFSSVLPMEFSYIHPITDCDVR